MLVYLFIYMIGQQLNMGTTYWILFWVCFLCNAVASAIKFILNRSADLLAKKIFEFLK